LSKFLIIVIYPSLYNRGILFPSTQLHCNLLNKHHSTQDLYLLPS
jgi:hypothetical protein